MLRIAGDWNCRLFFKTTYFASNLGHCVKYESDESDERVDGYRNQRKKEDKDVGMYQTLTLPVLFNGSWPFPCAQSKCIQIAHLSRFCRGTIEHVAPWRDRCSFLKDLQGGFSGRSRCRVCGLHVYSTSPLFSSKFWPSTRSGISSSSSPSFFSPFSPFSFCID